MAQGRKFRYEKKVYKEIATRYKDGETCVQLAKVYGFSELHILRIVRLHGVKVRRMSEAKRGRPNYAKRLFGVETERKICEEYCNGKTMKKIARKYKTFHENISRILRRNKVSTRVSKETGKLKEYTSRWNGGVSYHPKGYKRLYMPDHPTSAKGGLIPEHRLIMEKYLGRELRRGEVVHHINGVPNDNRIENLQLMTESEHNKLHNGRGRRAL